jgi:hypothetical protein
MTINSRDSDELNKSEDSLRRLVAELDREIAENPTNVVAYERRGNVYLQLQEYQRAISNYNRALELDSEYEAAYRHRGQAYAALGYYQWAAADFGRAETLDQHKKQLMLPPQPIAYPTRKAKTSERKVYHAHHRLLWVLFSSFVCFSTLFGGLFFLLTVPIGAALGTDSLWEDLFMLSFSLFLLMLVPVTACWTHDLWAARLIIAPEGIILYGNGYRVYNPWWNIRGHGSMLSGMQQISGLLLAQPAREDLSLAEGMRQQRPTLEHSRWSQLVYKTLPALAILVARSPSSVNASMRGYETMISNLIPVSFYVQNWQNSEVAQLIAQYAPQASI